ncbi:hypothetical protein JXB22_07960 [candidate division WOR-3 bacterium]|nr:hypothetical protein [candidate division WOR-3 bacterium]
MVWCCVSCKKNIDPKFIEYLKAEQGLRARLANSSVLDDSLVSLEERFGINREAELEFLKNNPEQWVVVLKALRNEK